MATRKTLRPEGGQARQPPARPGRPARKRSAARGRPGTDGAARKGEAASDGAALQERPIGQNGWPEGGRTRATRLPRGAGTKRTVREYEVGEHMLRLSNLEKVFYPSTGFTKGDVINYYARISPFLLPHMRGRPLTLKRYPEGVEGEFFYQKTCPSNHPEFLETADVWSEGRGADIHYCMANNLESLVWLANAGNLEIHTFLHRAPDVLRPESVVFDLDPGLPAEILACAEVGLWIRDHLRSLGLKSFIKASGGKGMQLYIPLHGDVSYDDTKPFARSLAQAMETLHPRRITSNMRKDLRKGKIFIDWSQNDDHKTTVCVYSLRAQKEPRVSTPVLWKEVEEAHDAQDASLLRFGPEQAVERAERLGDLFAPVLTLRQRLPK